MPRKRNRGASLRSLLLVALLGLVGLALLIRIPSVNRRVSWQKEVALAYLGGIIHPAGPIPTPLAQAAVPPSPTAEPTIPQTEPPTPTTGPTSTPESSPTPSPSPTPLPPAVRLSPPAWEKQDINNCGPATLAMNLRYFGWEGDQTTIAELIKPLREDRNVNVEELVYYVRNRAGWLKAEFRVGGDLQLLKELLAAGIPVMIEESFYFEEPFWPNDDLWAAHYQLLTGYDDSAGVFIGQDSFHGADRPIPYESLNKEWKVFNRVYILVYLPQQEETIRAILGESWDPDANRQHALEVAQAETEANPEDPFAWFNLGTNQVYFERYADAARAYDTARTLGLPQRMLRYQFGPFLAYFHAYRNEELLALTEYALQRTANAEEALLWHGWALYNAGDTNGAVGEFRKALEANPNYIDAQYALDFLGVGN